MNDNTVRVGWLYNFLSSIQYEIKKKAQKYYTLIYA